LRDYGIDTEKDWEAHVEIDNDVTVAFFGPRGDQGWRLETSATLLEENIDDCKRQHDLVYGHGPSNDYYLATFREHG
jgi:hypothetical protein